MNRYRRAGRFLAVTLVVYAALVATHLGEFWPFSIYPMFSQAGQPWTRTVVREVDAQAVPWTSVSLSELPGRPLPLAEHGVFQNDLANYVQKAETWDEARVTGVRRMFRGLEGRRLVVYRVRGQLTDERRVDVRAEPVLLLAPDTTLLNPALTRPEPS